jgi:hypothetical protein
MINHAKGFGRSMDDTCNDILSLQQRLILKRDELRAKAKEKEIRKKVRKLNDEESKL